MIKVFGTIIDAENNNLSNKRITFEWVDKNNMPIIGFTSDGIIIKKGEATTDASGYFEIFLVPNTPPPNETYYQIGVDVETKGGYQRVITSNIYLDGVATEVDLSGLLVGEHVQVPDTPIVDTLYVLNVKSDGTRVWEVLPAGNGSGDVLWSQIDPDGDNKVDEAKNAETVNNLTVLTQVPANAIFTDTIYDDTNVVKAPLGVLPALDGSNLTGLPNGVTDHTKLSNIGTYTHVEIDAHIDNASLHTDTIYTHPATHPATMIAEDATHRFVTDAEKTTWNAKSDFSGSYNDLTDQPVIPPTYDDSDVLKDSDTLSPVTTTNKLMTSDDVAGLGGGDMVKAIYDTNDNGKVDNAENADTVNGLSVETAVPLSAVFTDTIYTHPSSHPATMITQDASNRFVTDTEKTTWNNKSDGYSDIEIKTKYESNTNTNAYTDAEKTKVATIDQPVSSTEKSTWDSKQDAIPANTYQPYNIDTVIDASYVHTDNNLTTSLKTNYDTAYTHSQSPHAPVDADNTAANETSHATVANVDTINTWQKGQNSLHETIPFATTLSLDGDAISNSIHIDATADFTLNIFSNIPSGIIRGGIITVTQDATGGRVATFTGWTVTGNTATTVANTTAIYDYEFVLGVGYIKLREVV